MQKKYKIFQTERNGNLDEFIFYRKTFLFDTIEQAEEKIEEYFKETSFSMGTNLVILPVYRRDNGDC